jgi:hypothetical protein
MLMPKKDNMDGLDDFMLKSKDLMVHDMPYHPQKLANWEHINKGVPDNTAFGRYKNQYYLNGEQHKPTHIVYV